MRKLHYSASDGYKLKALYFAAECEGMPLIVDIHGGGFATGDAEGDEKLCERLREETGFCTVSLDYRLAPKWKFPTAINDCCDLLQGMLADDSLTFDREKIFVIGHSAGANLAVALARKYGKIRLAVLNYPWLEVAVNKRKFLSASIPGHVLDLFCRKYCSEPAQKESTFVNPLRMSREEAGKLPPSLVIVGGSDSLRVDGIGFAKLLQEAGVNCKLCDYPSARHGFIEIVASGRMKKNFYTSEKTVREQIGCFEQAITQIASFFKENA